MKNKAAVHSISVVGNSSTNPSPTRPYHNVTLVVWRTRGNISPVESLHCNLTPNIFLSLTSLNLKYYIFGSREEAGCIINHVDVQFLTHYFGLPAVLMLS